jgi:hypothetical protein
LPSSICLEHLSPTRSSRGASLRSKALALMSSNVFGPDP